MFLQCMENCFWKRFLLDPSVSCVVPSLLTKEINLTKPSCWDRRSEKEQFENLELALDSFASRSRNCNCQKRCNVIDFHIFGDPAPLCQRFPGSSDDGTATLFFSFPSKRVLAFFPYTSMSCLSSVYILHHSLLYSIGNWIKGFSILN